MKKEIIMLEHVERHYGSDSIGVIAGDLGTVIGAIKEGIPYSSLERLQQTVGISQKNLAQAVNINQRTLTRRKKELRFHSDESERLLRIGRIVDRAIGLMEGDSPSARRWLISPAKALGGKTPLEYADTEPGAQEVMSLIGRLEHGVFS